MRSKLFDLQECLLQKRVGAPWLAAMTLLVLWGARPGFCVPLMETESTRQPAEVLHQKHQPPRREMPQTKPPELKRLDLPAVHTSRAILAVGTLEHLDTATSTSTVTLRIDRNRSSLPRYLLTQAVKASNIRDIVETQLPERREFVLSEHTWFFDGRDSQSLPQVPALSGRIQEDPQLLSIQDFEVGQTVGILFRMSSDPSQPAKVLNMSLLEPDQTGMRVDYHPISGRPQPMLELNETTTSMPSARPERVELPASPAKRAPDETDRQGLK